MTSGTIKFCIVILIFIIHAWTFLRRQYYPRPRYEPSPHVRSWSGGSGALTFRMFVSRPVPSSLTAADRERREKAQRIESEKMGAAMVESL